MAELADLAALEMLASWDMQVMMPARGGPARDQQLGTLAGIAHARATDEQLGEWLAGAEAEDLDELQRDVVRIARRDWDRARRVPEELAAERAQAAAEGQRAWQQARADDNFDCFVPALRRNVELARACGECLSYDGESAYQALLSDYDFGLQVEELRRLFSALVEGLPALLQGAGELPPRRELDVPVEAQRAAVAGTLRRIGVEWESWRVDVSAHPFTAWMGRLDTRVTTRYSEGGVESLLSSLHEYGHALYERQVDPALERTNLGRGTSMSIHESQSKLWENHVARSPSFAEVLCAELDGAGFSIEPGELHASLVAVERTPIRVSADPLTYPLHIVLRFELELSMIEGALDVADLPEAWREGMRRLLGIEVRSDAEGCLQDMHWGAGSFGYFPSYALGCLIAAQLWEQIERELGSREEDLRYGEVAPIQRWLAERIHRHGRRLDTAELVSGATGRPLEIEPFLRYVSRFVESAGG